MKMRKLLLGALLAGLAVGSARADEILNIGDPAPKLTVSKFVKGEKVEGFEPGKTYVVEFWATWCGPCRASIPHVTELAHKHKDVRFIGVDVWERDTKLVEPFLKEMGDKMDYSVALDAVPGNDPNEGAMAKNWMRAAVENGIPAAFIVHDNKIAWIGHPMNMDEPLELVLAGTWDLKEKAAERLAGKEKERKQMLAQQNIFMPFQAKNWKATISAIEELASTDPELAEEYAPLRFAALANNGDVEAALALGEKLIEKNDDPGALNTIAWYVVDPDLKTKLDPRVAKLALKAALRANEVTGNENMALLDTLAHAHFATGDAKSALATEEKALEALKATVKNPAHPYYKQFNASLEKFRKASAN
jgi:thiol-disulfide isomerase/thioredoxin